MDQYYIRTDNPSGLSARVIFKGKRNMDRNEVSYSDWHRIDIVAALHKEGLTMRDLSTRAGLRPDTLKNALARSYPKGERIIADALGVLPQDIWPSRYSNRVNHYVSNCE